MLFRLLVLFGLVLGAAGAQAQALVDVCNLPDDPGGGSRSARTSVGNYEVYIANRTQQLRYRLDSTSFDLQGLAREGDLGTSMTAEQRSQIIGMFYTFERVGGATGNDVPTYPVWYFIPHAPEPLSGDINAAPIIKHTYVGQFGSGGGSRTSTQVGTFRYKATTNNNISRLNASVTMNGRTAHYCLILAPGTPANEDDAPGSSVQGFWSASATGNAFPDGSVSMTRNDYLRAHLTFFDQRSGEGEPVWAYGDILTAPSTFPLNASAVTLRMGYNGEAWDCDKLNECLGEAAHTSIGTLSSLRLGTSASGGSPATLNYGRMTPSIALVNAPYGGATLQWQSASEQSLYLSDCVVRIDATPAGQTPGAATNQGNCPESTPVQSSYYDCPTSAGQSSCTVRLRWRISSAYRKARVVAVDPFQPNTIAAQIASEVLESTGTDVVIPAGKTYRFDVLSGTGNAPVIGRTQSIRALGSSVINAAGCSIAAGATTCTASVNWSTSASATAFAFRIALPSGTPVQVGNGVSGSVGDPVVAGSYRYELHSSTAPTAQTRLATSADIQAAAAAGSSNISVSPSDCPIVAPATTCTATINWSTSQVATAYLFRVGTNPVVAGQLVSSVGSNGSTPQALAAGRFKFELRSSNSASGTNLLATSNEVNVFAGSLGEPATPPTPGLPSVPPVDAESNKVGFTGGMFRVDEAGNANYSVPIEVAAGRGGLAPKLALTYSSGNGDAVAGWGTGIEGLGAITRCRFTVEAGDGANRPIGLFAADYTFCLNGQRLILVSGVQGQKDASYRTEIDSYQRITIDDVQTVLPNGSGTPITQPTSFTVYTKDGLIVRYGSDTGRRLATLPSNLGVSNGYVEDWWLSNIADRNGNSIAFNYSGNAAIGSLRLDSVVYAGGRIDFSYVARTPVVSIGALGARLQQNSLMTGITSRNGAGIELRTLQLTHEAIPSNPALRRLASLASCNAGVCQAPTIFDWHDLAAGSQDTSAQGSLPAGGANFQDIRAFKYGDVNGDGRSDIVWVDKTKTLRVTYSAPTSAGIGFSASTAMTNIECERNAERELDPCSSQGYNRTWALLDVNGDGREDLIVYQNQAWRLWKGGPGGFTLDASFALTDPANQNLVGTPRVMLADFDGDGLADLLVNRAGFTADTRAWMMRRTSSGGNPFTFEGPKPVVQVNESGTVLNPLCNLGDLIGMNGDRGEALDFNNDGIADLALRVPVNNCLTAGGDRGNAPPPDWEALSEQEPGSAVVDPDSSGGTAVFFTSKGVNASGQLTFVARPSLFGLAAANEDAIRFGDLNGDGIADAVVRQGGNTAPGTNNWDEVWTYFYGTPNGWDSGSTANGLCVRADAGGNCLPVSRQGQLSLLDYDGDGRMDVWSRRYSSSPSGDFTYDVMLWNGSGFGAPTATFFHGGDTSWMRGFADLDGDGYYDNLIMRANEDQASWKAKRSNAHHKPRNLLKSVGHGLGANTYIDYAPTTFSTVYGRQYTAATAVWGRGSAVQDVHAPRFVVSRTRSSAPTESNPANLAEMRYRYSGFRMQGGGRGGLGFDRVVSVDVANSLTTMTQYFQAFPLTGLPRFTQVWSQGLLPDTCVDPDAASCMTDVGASLVATGTVFSSAADTWKWQVDGVSGTSPLVINIGSRPIRVMRHFSGINKRDASDFLSASNTTFTAYDAYGNLTQSTTTDYADSALTTAVRTIATTSSFDNDTTRWILGRLRSTTVTTSRPNMPSVTRNTTFDYNASTGQLEVERLQPAGAPAERLTKIHSYDSYGNEKQVITCGYSLTEQACSLTTPGNIQFRPANELHVQRVGGVGYDASGVFVDYEWSLFQDPSGSGATMAQTMVVDSRDARGNPTNMRDVNGVRSVAGYDGFGRKYFEGSATGGWSQLERRWCAGFPGATPSATVPCPGYAVYRLKTTAAGGATIWAYFDLLDREVLRVQQGFGETEFSAVRKTYDALGRGESVSEPYFTFAPTGSNVGQPSGVAIYRTTSGYDVFGRLVLTTHPNHGGGVVSQTQVIPAGQRVTRILPANGSGVTETTVQEVNALGELSKVTDHLGSVLIYEYDAVGNVTAVRRQTHDGKNTATTATYDGLGRKLSIIDPDAGTRYFVYNALGEVVRKTAQGSCERSWYDARGRVYSRQNFLDGNCGGSADASSTWQFDLAVNGKGAPAFVVHNDESTAYSRAHLYDSFGRGREVTTSVDGADYVESTTYDQYGRPFQSFFSGTNLPRSGELRQYNTRGYATTTRNAFPGTTGQIYYEVLSGDAAGRVLQERRYNNGNLTTSRSYDPATGRVKAIVSGGGSLQSLGYDYDTLGNMSWREDRSGGGNLREEFGYDSLQRLTSVYARRADGSQGYTMSTGYDGLGNSSAFTAGTPQAGCTDPGEVSAGPGAISSIGSNSFCYDARGNQVRTLDPANGNGLEKRKIRYSSYDSAREIRSNNPFSQHTVQFGYGPERQMIVRRDYDAATPTGTPTTTYYAAGAEIILKPGTTQKEVRRTVAGMIFTQTVTASGMLAATNTDVLLVDVLGSTHRITDTAGVPRPGNGEQSFSAFGQRSSAVSGFPLDGNGRFRFDDSRTRSGYTGHQQADANGVIHMGARIYDPVLGRFLQADSVVPDPGDLQSLNRYSYVSNNPLAYTDPTGHWGAQQQGYLRTVVAIAIAVWTGVGVSAALDTAAISSAAGGAASGTWMGMTVTASNAGLYVMAGGFAAGAVQSGTLRGAVTGAFSSVVSFGIGNAYQLGHITGSQHWLAHSAAGGFTDAINGGKFGHGFASAGLSVALTPMIKTGNDFTDGVLHVIVGGTAAEVGGGKFANGAATALFSYAFNEAAHSATKKRQAKIDKIAKQQIDLYNPRSIQEDAEYAGVIFMLDDKIQATEAVRSACSSLDCSVDVSAALNLVPAGAVILADWHTHGNMPYPEASRYTFSDPDFAGMPDVVTQLARNGQNQYVGAYVGTTVGAIHFLPTAAMGSANAASQVVVVRKGKTFTEESRQ